MASTRGSPIGCSQAALRVANKKTQQLRLLPVARLYADGLSGGQSPSDNLRRVLVNPQATRLSSTTPSQGRSEPLTRQHLSTNAVLQSLSSSEHKDLTPTSLRQKAAQFALDTVNNPRESLKARRQLRQQCAGHDRQRSRILVRCSVDDKTEPSKESGGVQSSDVVTTTVSESKEDGANKPPPTPVEEKEASPPPPPPTSLSAPPSPSPSPSPTSPLPSGPPPSPPKDSKDKDPFTFDTVRIVQLLAPEKVSPDDVAVMKSKLFGFKTFFMTGQEPFGEAGEGVLIRGNLRGKMEEVYETLRSGMQDLFGDKYEMLMIDEPPLPGSEAGGGVVADMADSGGGSSRRVSFVIFRSEITQFPPTPAWQYLVAILLAAITGGCCLELGLVAQISNVPPEIIRYFSAPNPETLPAPDIDQLAPFVDKALPLALGVFGVQVFHELAHWIVAAQRRVQLGTPFLIPNITIGSFGTITPFKSLCPDRTAKFDVSIIGPIAGASLSASIFMAGLLLSLPGAGAAVGLPSIEQELVKVPSLLFQGSLLLGAACRAVLGYDIMHAQSITIHPMLIAGWCGLTVSALNLLPVGSLDGGRAMQAAFGRGSLAISSTLCYIFLALGLIGGALSLPFGLFVLIVQRGFERPCLNDVTEIGVARKVILGISILVAVATVLPLWDDLADYLGIGLGATML